MKDDPIERIIDEYEHIGEYQEFHDDEDFVVAIETTSVWNKKIDELARDMWENYG